MNLFQKILKGGTSEVIIPVILFHFFLDETFRDRKQVGSYESYHDRKQKGNKEK
jgi:hypothetical protein